MKAGDIIVSKGLFSWPSLGIRVLTLSRWTHVGILIDENTVLEANVKNAYGEAEPQASGVYFTDVKKFRSSAKRSVVFERNSSLSGAEKAKLLEYGRSLQGVPYNPVRASSSNIIPMLRNLYFSSYYSFFVLPFILYGIFEATKVSADCNGLVQCSSALGSKVGYYFLIATVLAFLTHLGWRLMRRSLYQRGPNNWFRALLRRLGLPDVVMNAYDEIFCSQLVADADGKVGGSIKLKLKRTDEARPKDIYEICSKNKAEWTKVKL